jgi:hypothetical protein
LITLKGILNTFAQLYRQEISDDAVIAYDAALQHLSSETLKIACNEAIKKCKFFPNPAEIITALEELRAREPAASSAWQETLENPNSQWNRALRYNVWKEKQPHGE